MSTTIDQKVVEMRFDNSQFEKNVGTTLGSLEKLKSSLNFKGASKGLEEVESTARRFDMSPMGNAVENVRLKFSALEVMAVTALANITNSAVNAGMRIVSALAIDPITTGFNEYELKMGSIQTMMAATGESLETVNGYLNELNAYSDKTIYSFSDMTQNIGKFTNAGVSLKDSVAAIQGISNVAAVSGANANEASRAMYNLAQALSSGYVKLIDWKSIELANMGTVEFKEQLIEAAVAAGTLTKTGDGMYKTLKGKTISATKGFNDSLADQWMTSEVLINTLQKYSDETTEIGKKATKAATEVKTLSMLYDTLKEAAQSGWAQTWEIIVGDFEEAKEFMTYLSETIGDLIGSAADARNDMLENWKALGGRTALLDSIKNIIEGIGSVLKPVAEAFKEIFPPLTAERLLSFCEGLRNLTERLKISDETADKIKRTFKGVFAVVNIVRQIFVASINAVSSLSESMEDLGGGVLDLTASFGDWLTALSDMIERSGILGKIFQGIASILKSLMKGVSNIAKFINGKFASPGVERLQKSLDSVSNGMTALGEIAGGVRDILVSSFDAVGSAFESSSFVKLLGGIWNVIKVLGEGIINIFGTLIDKMADFDVISGIMNGLLSGSFLVLLYKLFDIGDVIGDVLGGLGDALEGLQARLKGEALKQIATAILILVGALLILSCIDTQTLVSSTGAIALLLTELCMALSALNKMNTNISGVVKMWALVKMIDELARALLTMSIAMAILGTMSFTEMLTALIGLAGAMAILIGAVYLLPDKKASSAASAIKKLSTALLIFSVAMKILSTLSWEQVAIGLVAAVVGLGALVAAVNLLPKDVSVKTACMISLSIALVILAGALKILSTISWKELAVSMTALAGALTIIIAAMRIMEKSIKGAIIIAIVAQALIILAGALKILSTMSWGEVARGMVALGGAMLILAAGLYLMKSSLAGSAALLVAAMALAVLAPVLALLGSMSWASIAKGLITIAGAFTVIGIAGALLSPYVGAIMYLAAAFALIGLGALAAGVGLMAMGAGLSAIAVGITAVFASLVSVSSGLVSMITTISVGIAEGIVAFCKVIASGVPVIGEAIKALILECCSVIIECVPAIVETVLQLIVKLLTSLAEHTPTIVNALFDFIVGLLDSLAANTPRLIKALTDIFMSVFVGALEAIGDMDTDTLLKGLLAIGMMTAIVASLAAVVPLIPIAMVGVVGVGLVIAELAAVLAAIGVLAQTPGLKWLIAEGGDFLQVVGTAIGQFIGGICGGLAQGITAVLPKLADDLSVFMTRITPFIEGAKTIDKSALTGIRNLVEIVLLITATSMIQGLTSWIGGVGAVSKFASDLVLLGEGLKGFSDAVIGVSVESVIAASTALTHLSDAVSSIPNSGGLLQLITGKHDMSKFASELPKLGSGLKGFSDAVVGIIPANVIAAADAAKALAEMTTHIPLQGGLVSWFTGETSVSKFAGELPKLGSGLKGFSDAVVGIIPENIIAAANAAKALADMTAAIPDTGGIVAWFTGENSVSKFASDLVNLGMGLKNFSIATSGIIPESVVAAANAAKALAEMTTHIPLQGGLVSWFTGENSVSKFAGELPKLGSGLKGFSDAVVGINPEQVTAAAESAKSIAEMTQSIPKEGGIKAWFTGETSISKFAGELPKLGSGLKGFSASVAGISPENVTAAANAAKALAEMTDIVPKNTDKIVSFGKNIDAFGGSLASYFSKTSNVSSDVAGAMGNIVDTCGKFALLDADAMGKGASAIKKLVDAIKSTSDISADAASGFISALKKVAEISVDSIVKTFDDLADRMKTIGKKAVEALAKGISDNTDTATTAGEGLATACADAIEEKVGAFETSGKNLVRGFANGISMNAYLAEAKARAMAKAAAEAAADELDEHSPSKVGYGIGDYFGVAFVNGVADNIEASYDTSAEMASSAKNGLRDALGKVGSVLGNDLDMQPTIRPVLDLSDVEYGVGRLNSMLGGDASVGILTNVGAISFGMNHRGQNGNFNDVVKSVDKLGDKLDNVGNTTYIVEGVTYDDGSNVASAVEELIHAAKVDRRT